MNVEIKIVGTGLLGTSLGLALARQGVVASLDDASSSNLRLAVEYGAGEINSSEPDLVVVCVPPDFAAKVVLEQLQQHPNAIVTDVTSVKTKTYLEVQASGLADRYIGSHPMAGREKGGPGAARADLFFARPWVITAAKGQEQQAKVLSDLALRVGALPTVMTAEEHDAAVAVVSHFPQIVSSALAASLNSGSSEQLALAGQGLRDTTRIAASDPDLWLQIIAQNAAQLLPLVQGLKRELEQLESALDGIDQQGALAKIHNLLSRGNQGVSLIPGKHGGVVPQ